MFVRGSSLGSIVSNDSHDNCIGIFFLNAPNPDTNWVFSGNQVNHNNKVCGHQGPAGAGVVVGGHGIVIQANTVDGNVASPTSASGGTVLVAGSSGNTVVANTAHDHAVASRHLRSSDSP